MTNRICNTVMLPVDEYEELKRAAAKTQQILKMILLEKQALQRWINELEKREATIRKWLSDDTPAAPSAVVGSPHEPAG